MPDGAGGFSRDSSRPGLLRIPATRASLPLRDYHPLRRAFPGASGRNTREPRGSYYPGTALTAPVWAVPLPLAATHGITVVFSSSAYLDVSVRRVRLPTRSGYHSRGGLPHSDTRGSTPLAGPRGFSQLGTSFFAPWSPGIPRAPFSTCYAPCPLLPGTAPDGTPSPGSLRSKGPAAYSVTARQ